MTEKEKEVWRDIFELYKDMPCLWDISNVNYLNRDMRNQAMEILLEKYKEADEDANMSVLKKKIENMRTSYRRELKKVKASVRTGAGTEDIYTPTLWYFELLHFLDEKNEQSRRGVDTLDSSDEVSNNKN
ncbi:hypothetical protein ANN_09229 [Periplaneta americana]|uniref:MADF domain-containing protein n=1 Tax=Periplaneta americana TaxID=6978 RepID=A0ABQ8TMU4_PERAM|nr:hypothetical protein ANN_09229 [Periplaneta americana]